MRNTAAKRVHLPFMQLCCIMAAVCKNHGQAMSIKPNRSRAAARANSALGASALERLLWAALALALLWTTIGWALS